MLRMLYWKINDPFLEKRFHYSYSTVYFPESNVTTRVTISSVQFKLVYCLKLAKLSDLVQPATSYEITATAVKEVSLFDFVAVNALDAIQD